MIVKNNIVKFNDNNCKNINNYMCQGLSTIQSFDFEIRKNRHNPNKIIGYEYRYDKWHWLFKLLEIELEDMKSKCIQSY